MAEHAAEQTTEPSATPFCTERQARIERILGVMGGVIRVPDEGHVDMATAVNGTGPAIIAQFVKAMMEAAAYIGESRTVAKETVLATMVQYVAVWGLRARAIVRQRNA